MSRGKVLFVHAVPSLGGSTRVAIDDARALANGGYAVGFAADRDTIFEALADKSIKFHRLHFVDPERHSRAVRYLIGMPLSTILLAWIVWRNHYDCLYVQHRQSGWPARIVSLLTGVRYVFISHSELSIRNRGRWATPLGNDVIAVSRHVKQNIVTYFGIPESRVMVIPNAVRIDVSRPTEEAVREFNDRWAIAHDAPVVACVAQLVPIKAHDVLFAAWARVMQAMPQAVLILAGSGPLEESLVRLCRDQGLGPSIRFLGPVHDVSLVYSRADVLVLASRSEGMPLSVLEALSYETPVVATAVSGVKEIVISGETGLLVEPDDLDGLARALTDLLCNPVERRRMGAAGRRLVADHYSLELRGRTLCEFFGRASSGACLTRQVGR